MNSQTEKLLSILGDLVSVLIGISIKSLMVKVLYNCVPLPFQHNPITYFQATGLFLLCNLLFRNQHTKETH